MRSAINALLDANADRKLGKSPSIRTVNDSRFPRLTICQQINKAMSLSAWISRFVNLKNTGFSTGLEKNPSKNSTFATQVSSALLLGT